MNTPIPQPPETITKREYFAALALIGFHNQLFSNESAMKSAVENAVHVADLLILELERTKPAGR